MLCRIRCLSLSLLLGLLTAGLVPSVFGAVLVPEVKDDAGFFSAEAVKKANVIIKEIKNQFDKDLIIETYKAIPKDLLNQFEKEGKSPFFRDWARSRAKSLEVNGVFILICKDPGHLEVEVGNVTGQKAFTTGNRDKLAGLLLEKFRAKEFDRALLDGSEYVQQTLKSNVGKKAEVGSQPAPHARTGRGTSSTGWFSGFGGLLCMGLLLVLGVWLIVGLIRAFSGGGAGGGMGGGMGGGGLMTGLLGGLFGAMAGSWIYDSFFRDNSWGSSAHGSESSPDSSSPQDTDYSGSGGDFGGAGGDAGGGGGDFGGGGGDFGGGGGDFGGGGGDF
jgi:hypothetical protein